MCLFACFFVLCVFMYNIPSVFLSFSVSICPPEDQFGRLQSIVIFPLCFLPEAVVLQREECGKKKIEIKIVGLLKITQIIEVLLSLTWCVYVCVCVCVCNLNIFWDFVLFCFFCFCFFFWCGNKKKKRVTDLLQGHSWKLDWTVDDSITRVKKKK